MPSIAGITWQRLQQEDSVTSPCHQEGDPGEPVIFTADFPTASGKGRLVPTQLITADEVPDDEYPKVLITGRQLEHWHTGSMTRRSRVLDAIEPIPVVNMHPDELAQIDIREGDQVRVISRRGELLAAVRTDDGLRPGQVFIAFCYHEAAANLLTNDVLDPTGKIPEFKYCAVRVEAAV
jgi:formate dehydrogenase major subunit